MRFLGLPFGILADGVESEAEVTRSVGDEPKITLKQVWGSLTVGQVWAVLTAIVAVLGVSFGLGALIQSGRDNSVANTKDQEIALLNTEASSVRLANEHATVDFQTKNSDLTRTIDALKASLVTALTDKEAFEGKAEFLNRYASYLQGPGDISKKLLVDVVCRMWRETQKRRINVVLEPLALTTNQLVSGLDQNTQQLLFKNGVPPELIERVQRPEAFVNRGPTFTASPFTVNPPSNPRNVRRDAIATIQKQTQNLQVIKIITFFDGTQYQMSQEIAVAVHTKAECSP